MKLLFMLVGMNLLPFIVGQAAIANSSCLPFPARSIPRNVTIIQREELAQPTSHHIEDILRQRVPGLNPNIRGNLSLRGRPALVRVNGVPVANGDEILRGLSPEMIERIEVIPGSTPWCSN